MKNLKKLLSASLILLIFFLFTAQMAAAETDSKKTNPQEKNSEAWYKKMHIMRIIPIVNLDILGVYSKIQSHDAITGASINGTFSPAIKFNSRNYLIPLYNISYDRQRQIISQEEGGRLNKETLTHNFFLTYKRKMTPRLTAKLSGLGTVAYYKETNDEKWSKGLYDYIDKGGLLDFEYALTPLIAKSHKEVGFEIEYYRRTYTNYHSLISLATPTATEENEKDYDGIKLGFNYLSRNPNGLSWELNYEPLLKYYTDKLVVGSDGVLISGKRRNDNQHTLSFNLNYPLTKKLSVGLNNQLIINRSNQNFYDSRDTVGLGDDVFTADYYDYNSYEIKPMLSYDIPFKKKNLTVNLSYSFLDRQYTDRNAQDAGGTYKGSDEKDKFHTVTLGLSYPLTKNIKAVAYYQFVKAESNMRYEKYYRYNYDLMSAEAGISCRF